ncbi:phosphotransferase [Nocardioides sp. zg-1308]|uniref:phosphotransferase enzyme family protein n=1 Tax=Nocardioides sp. zg-1308 TaxID=2736253 RepID=UPI001553BE7E|nr:phosphotransferase [Nocardioides sp. zg-1308]
MIDPSELLTRFWGLDAPRVRPLDGGMNSSTWLVEHRGAVYVAKLVPASGVADLAAGADVATMLAAAGFLTGRPVPALDGRIVVTEHALALLEHVPGRELVGDTDAEQEWIAEVLAGVHVASEPGVGPRTATFAQDWLSPAAPGVESHPWLLAAIEAARAATDSLRLMWSVLHTDPAPEAFVHDDETQVTGLIDWAGARRGPVLYDVASAVMYLGGPHEAATFLRAYQATGPLDPTEMQHLDAFRLFREAVQGVYFATRLASDDLTGDVEVADNEKGLADARRRLEALGAA